MAAGKIFVISDYDDSEHLTWTWQIALSDKLFVIERTLKSIRTEKEKSLKTAVDTLYKDYKTNTELTIFTKLDKEPFYETRWNLARFAWSNNRFGD